MSKSMTPKAGISQSPARVMPNASRPADDRAQGSGEEAAEDLLLLRDRAWLSMVVERTHRSNGHGAVYVSARRSAHPHEAPRREGGKQMSDSIDRFTCKHALPERADPTPDVRCVFCVEDDLRVKLAAEVARREQAERERDEALRDMGHMLDKREELEEELKLSRRAFGDLHQHLVDRKEGAEAALFAMAQKAELAIMITDGIVYLPATGRMTTREVLKLEADVARLTAAHREVREKLEAAESRIKIERKIRKGAIGAYCALREKAWALLNASKAHLSDDDALDTWNRCADACSELDAALAAKPEGGERHGQD